MSRRVGTLRRSGALVLVTCITVAYGTPMGGTHSVTPAPTTCTGTGSQSPSVTATPTSTASCSHIPYPGTTTVLGNVLNAVVDIIAPFPAQNYISRRLSPEEDSNTGGSPLDARDDLKRSLKAAPHAPAHFSNTAGGAVASDWLSSARRSLAASLAASATGPPAPAFRKLLFDPGQGGQISPFLTCLSGDTVPDDYFNSTCSALGLGEPIHVSDWCLLAHFQPHVLSFLAAMNPDTIFIPTDAAFQRLLGKFPAFYEWLAGFPSCYAGFNRMEYFLQLHASANNITCNSPPPFPGTCSSPFHSLNFNGWEQLAVGRVSMEPCGCADNVACRVDRYSPSQWSGVTAQPPSTDWQWSGTWGRPFDCTPDNHANSPNVLWQFQGSNGNILVLDEVLIPTAHPWAVFPSGTLLGLIETHPQLTHFATLVNLTGVDALLFNPPIGSEWHSKTVFAPVDSAFAALDPKVWAYLISPAGRATATYIVLSHFLRGITYVYDCSYFQLDANWSNVTQIMESTSRVTISGTGGALTLGYGPFSGSPYLAHTIPPWTNLETRTGILHKIDNVLIDGIANALITAAVYGSSAGH